MKSRITLLPVFLLLGTLVLNACGGAAAPEAPAMIEEMPAEAAAIDEPAGDVAVAPQQDASGVNALKQGTIYDTGTENNAAATTRMVIKNAEIRLLVEDSNRAIDKLTQIVGDTGGYIVSSQVEYQMYNDGKNYKYATITIGVPSVQFERALNRIRSLAIQVTNETASGEDVTDQYVDLQSQLTNLEATRDRVKSFLDNAQNVDEALRINQQLSDIERQIEEIKGRMNYLSDRSAFSTITVNIDPQLPVIVTEPTPEPGWQPGETLKDAQKVLTKAYQGIVDFLIWVFVVILPIVAPPILIIWLLAKWISKKSKKVSQ